MGLYQDSREDTLGNTFVNLNDGSGNAISSTTGFLNVNISGGSTSGKVVDQSAFAYGTDTELPVGGVFNDTGATLTTGTTGALRLTALRGLHINLRNNAGTEIGTSGAPVRIDPTGTTAQPVTDNGGSLTVDGTVAATQSGTWNITNISGTISLPTGAATEATLAAINGKISPASAALTQIARSNTSQTMLASNAARKGFIATNDSGAVAYIGFTATTTSAAYTYRVQSNSTVEPNFGSYTGVISVIWGSNGAGNMVVTELS